MKNFLIYNIVPAVIGAVVAFLFSYVVNGIIHGVMALWNMGAEQEYIQAFSYAPKLPLFITIVSCIAGYIVGGCVIADISQSQPYLNAFIAGVLLSAWLFMMCSSAIYQVEGVNFLIILRCLLPIPIISISTYFFLRYEIWD